MPSRQAATRAATHLAVFLAGVCCACVVVCLLRSGGDTSLATRPHARVDDIMVRELRKIREQIDGLGSHAVSRPTPIFRSNRLTNVLRLAKYDCQNKPDLIRDRDGEAVVVEVGSYDGMEAKKLAPYARQLYVFEATPTKEATIRRNLGGAMAKVELHMAAVGDTEGSVELHLPDGESGAQQDSVSDQSFWAGKTKTVSVPMVRLDEVVQEHVDLLKVDVQGYDFRVLVGATGLIEEHGVDIIHVEFSPKLLASARSDPTEMLYWLRDHGYHCMDCEAFSPPPPFQARTFEAYPAAFGAFRFRQGDHGSWGDLICYAI